jgi:hypothetical protein
MFDIARMYRAQLHFLRAEADTQLCFAAHLRFDESCTHLIEMEGRTGLLHRLMPGGQQQGSRKLLSYFGGLGPDHQRDPMNWYWAVLMKAFLYQCPSMSVAGSCGGLRGALQWLNDETLGDHWEAILGLELWSRNEWRNAPRTSVHMPFLSVQRSGIVEYAQWINEAMHMLEHFIIPYLLRHRFIADIWTRGQACTSREAAVFMV